MTARRALRRLRAEVFERAGWNVRARQRLDGTRAAVLLYHRVLPEERARREAVEEGMYVTPASFAGHCDWLAECFRVLPLHEIVTRLADDKPLPPLACALTFDDGWRDNFEHALPELERRGLPATIFVVTGRVGSPGAFWPDEVCRRLAPLPPARRSALAGRLGARAGGDPVQALLAHLKALSEAERPAVLDALRAETPDPGGPERELCGWDELAALARGGVDVESHGATHAILTGLPEADVERELRESREALRARGHGRHALFVYPSGGHDERVCRLTRAAGYRAAFTIEPGLADRAADPLRLPRLGLHEEIARTRSELLFRIPGRS